MQSRFKITSKAAQRHHTPEAHRVRLEVLDELTKQGVYDEFSTDVCASIFYERYKQKISKLNRGRRSA